MKWTVAPWLKALAVGSLFVLWALAAHLGSSGIGPAGLNTLVALFPIVLTVLMLASQLSRRWVGVLVLLLGLLMLILGWPYLSGNVPLLYYLQHLGANLTMALFFGKTLRPGHEALISQLARRIEGGVISDSKARYTRWVTVAWTTFFCLNALVSTVLFLGAPVVVWSVHANLMTGPLLVVMFLGEYLVRMFFLPAHERPSLMTVVRAYRQATRQSAMRSNPPESMR